VRGKATAKVARSRITDLPRGNPQKKGEASGYRAIGGGGKPKAVAGETVRAKYRTTDSPKRDWTAQPHPKAVGRDG